MAFSIVTRLCRHASLMKNVKPNIYFSAPTLPSCSRLAISNLNSPQYIVRKQWFSCMILLFNILEFIVIFWIAKPARSRNAPSGPSAAPPDGITKHRKRQLYIYHIYQRSAVCITVYPHIANAFDFDLSIYPNIIFV